MFQHRKTSFSIIICQQRTNANHSIVVVADGSFFFRQCVFVSWFVHNLFALFLSCDKALICKNILNAMSAMWLLLLHFDSFSLFFRWFGESWKLSWVRVSRGCHCVNKHENYKITPNLISLFAGSSYSVFLFFSSCFWRWRGRLTFCLLLRATYFGHNPHLFRFIACILHIFGLYSIPFGF